MIVHKNPYFSVKKSNDYYSLVFPTEQVVILSIVGKDRFLFVKAIRYPFKEPVIEFPAGGVENGESVLDAGFRELKEETGIDINPKHRLKRAVKLNRLNTIPSRTSQMLNVIRIDITDDEYRNRQKHDDEVAGTLLLTKQQALKKIKLGEIFVATTISMCLKFLLDV